MTKAQELIEDLIEAKPGAAYPDDEGMYLDAYVAAFERSAGPAYKRVSWQARKFHDYPYASYHLAFERYYGFEGKYDVTLSIKWDTHDDYELSAELEVEVGLSSNKVKVYGNKKLMAAVKQLGSKAGSTWRRLTRGVDLDPDT